MDTRYVNNFINSDTDGMFNAYISEVNENKMLLLTLTTALAVYSGFFANTVAEYMPGIFENPFFQVAIFVIIIHIFPLSSALGVSLVIAIFVTLQAISEVKIKKSMDSFSPMDKSNMNDQHEVYLSSPVQGATASVPTIDLKLTTLEDKYDSMIKTGKDLLEDSQNIKNDLKNRPDFREKRIADIVDIKGKRMIKSGINRLESSDDGLINKTNTQSKFIKYDKSLATNNHDILSKYDEFNTNFNKLQNSLNNSEFEMQLDISRQNELELLELIYKNKKDSFSKKKQEQINQIINKIKHLHSKNKSWNNELKELSELLL
jgi:hypothetical protein